MQCVRCRCPIIYPRVCVSECVPCVGAVKIFGDEMDIYAYIDVHVLQVDRNVVYI